MHGMDYSTTPMLSGMQREGGERWVLCMMVGNRFSENRSDIFKFLALRPGSVFVDSLFLLFGVLFFFGVYLKS